MTEELKQQIELLRGDVSKSSCIALNEIRRGLDGTFLDTCFCSGSERRNFNNDFFRFYDSISK